MIPGSCCDRPRSNLRVRTLTRLYRDILSFLFPNFLNLCEIRGKNNPPQTVDSTTSRLNIDNLLRYKSYYAFHRCLLKVLTCVESFAKVLFVISGDFSKRNRFRLRSRCAKSFVCSPHSYVLGLSAVVMLTALAYVSHMLCNYHLIANILVDICDSRPVWS